MAPPTENPTERLSFLPDFPGRESLYRPLEADKAEIRVITVQPSEDRSSPINCIMQTISIQDGQSTVPYDAISYFWGSTATTENIIVYDKPLVDEDCYCRLEVPVTPALTGALRQLRARATRMETPLVLWTDAVCTHQLDATERSHQVTLMQNVYEAAASIIVWLGEGDPAAELGLVNLFGLAKYRQCNVADRDHETDAFDYYDFDATPDMKSLKRVDALFRNHPELDGTDHGDPDVSSWIQTVSALMDLTYWDRGWTSQEVCANNRLWLHYGQTRCRIKSLKSFVYPIFLPNKSEQWHGALLFQPRLFVRLIDWVMSMELARATLKAFRHHPFATRELWGQSCSRTTITKVLTHDLEVLARSSSQTSDPRDQVYSRICSTGGFMFLGIRPDYTLTTVQLFIATTIAILHGSQSWAHEQFFTPSESPYMPSWAIDFCLPPDPNNMISSNFKSSGFQADTMASFRLQESRLGRLFTAGFIYDDVVIAAPSDSSEDDTSFLAWCHILGAEGGRYILQNPAYSNLEDLAAAYYRTLCMGRVKGQKFGAEHSAIVAAAAFNTEELDDRQSDLLSRMHVQGMKFRKKGMKLIVTRKGNMGLAAHNVHVGDRIAILATGTVPFILRKVGEQENRYSTYILLGACYVDRKTIASARWGVYPL
jgi:hypothetical protein